MASVEWLKRVVLLLAGIVLGFMISEGSEDSEVPIQSKSSECEAKHTELLELQFDLHQRVSELEEEINVLHPVPEEKRSAERVWK